MTNAFFEHPIRNSPYEYPARHWELDLSGQPTGQIRDERRSASFLSAVPRTKKQSQSQIVFDAEPRELPTDRQDCELSR